MFDVEYYLFVAAKNRGWDVQYLRMNKPFLLKYTKDDLFFYSNRFVSVEVNHQSAALSDNKILTHDILCREGVPVVKVEKVGERSEEEHLLLYEKFSFGGEQAVVLKPIASYGAKGLCKCENYGDYRIALKEIDKEDYCLSSYIDHFLEMRFLVFRSKVVLIHPKYHNPKNLVRPHLTSAPHLPLSLLRKMKKTAVTAATALQYDYVAVDFLVSDEGFILLETNGNPSLLHYADQSPKQRNKAVRLFENVFNYKEQLLRHTFPR